ncbi:ATP-dependent DNA helicase [Trichonephila clavipes]|nr:ATP-dependent DNA helicase [Trichonephila clavipes]
MKRVEYAAPVEKLSYQNYIHHPNHCQRFYLVLHVCRSISWKISASTIHASKGHCSVQRTSVRENYMPTFRVQGQIYHHAGSLLPLPDADHKFLQIYFMANSDEQIEQHCHYNAGTRRGIVGALQGLFDQHNELVRLFKTAIQRMPADDYAVVIRADKRPVGQHERQLNAPTIDEVAIVIVGKEFESRDIILHRRSGDIQRVSETHCSYDGLQYPILFCER